MPIKCFAARDDIGPWYVRCVPFDLQGEIDEEGERQAYDTDEEAEAGIQEAEQRGDHELAREIRRARATAFCRGDEDE